MTTTTFKSTNGIKVVALKLANTTQQYTDSNSAPWLCSLRTSAETQKSKKAEHLSFDLVDSDIDIVEKCTTFPANNISLENGSEQAHRPSRNSCELTASSTLVCGVVPQSNLSTLSIAHSTRFHEKRDVSSDICRSKRSRECSDQSISTPTSLEKSRILGEFTTEIVGVLFYRNAASLPRVKGSPVFLVSI
jgi:hypothetical protein